MLFLAAITVACAPQLSHANKSMDRSDGLRSSLIAVAQTVIAASESSAVANTDLRWHPGGFEDCPSSLVITHKV